MSEPSIVDTEKKLEQLPASQRRRPVNLKEIRTAVADYMRSEGCSCCRDYQGHIKHEEILAKLLRVPKYKDGSGYNFPKFQSKP